MYCLPDQNICTTEQAVPHTMGSVVMESVAQNILSHAELIPLGVFNGRAYSYNKVGNASYILIQDEKTTAFDILGDQ